MQQRGDIRLCLCRVQAVLCQVLDCRQLFVLTGQTLQRKRVQPRQAVERQRRRDRALRRLGNLPRGGAAWPLAREPHRPPSPAGRHAAPGAGACEIFSSALSAWRCLPSVPIYSFPLPTNLFYNPAAQNPAKPDAGKAKIARRWLQVEKSCVIITAQATNRARFAGLRFGNLRLAAAHVCRV